MIGWGVQQGFRSQLEEATNGQNLGPCEQNNKEQVMVIVKDNRRISKYPSVPTDVSKEWNKWENRGEETALVYNTVAMNDVEEKVQTENHR